MNKNLFLKSDTAKELYEKAKSLPIIDWHNHLSAEDLRTDRRFTNAYDMWIRPDPYKHRAMRMCGIPEKYITGTEPDEEKFQAWWETLPKLMGNPLSVWSEMELEQIFGADTVADGKNAGEVFRRLNRVLEEKPMTIRSILRDFRVTAACPCAGFGAEISFYEDLEGLSPSLRGDDGVKLTHSFIERLEKFTGIGIYDLDSLDAAINLRLDAFQKAGCRFSDHAIDSGFHFIAPDGSENALLEKIMNGQSLTAEETMRLENRMLRHLLGEYAKRGMTVQLHAGALRSTSTRLHRIAGAAGGYAGIGTPASTADLASLLDSVEREHGTVPRTMLFCMSPGDYPAYATLSGSFSRDGEAGLVTLGPAWWWCDHKMGMEAVLEATAAFGLLWTCPGMTTDSRSVLSFVRHDYFRRVLCAWLGDRYEAGELGGSFHTLETLTKRICFENADAMWRENK